MTTKYNSFLKQHISLEEGEKFCQKCGGVGRVPRQSAKAHSRPYQKKLTLTCDKCLGEGKLDWVEKATGKRNKNKVETQPCVWKGWGLE